MLTVEELIDWLRADPADAETIEDLRAAAIAHVQNETGMKFGTAGEVVETHAYTGGAIALSGVPDPDASFSVEKWTGSAWEVVDEGSWYLDGAFVRPAQSSWVDFRTETPRFRVTYTTGFVEGLQPEPVKQAVRILVAHWFEHREAIITGTIATVVKLSVDRLLAPYRKVGF